MASLLLTIKDILALDHLQPEWYGPPHQTFHGVSTDSRSCTSGDLFFAIRGERFDGHHFVDAVLDQGAGGAVVDREWAQNTNLSNKPLFVVSNALEAYQDIARAHRMKFDIPVIALTGSSGKTTTKEMIFAVLSQRYKVHRSVKSFNNHIGVPATLFGLTGEHEILVAELGTNHFGELERLSSLVQPTVCLLLNIGYAHLEAFGDLHGVLQAKLEIFSGCQKGGVAVYSADDPMIDKRLIPLERKISFGTHADATVKGTVLGCDEQARYRFQVEDQTIQLQVPGRHNVDNALAAVAIGKQFSLSGAEIKRGLESFHPVGKRLHVERIGSLLVIDDSYNANPSSCSAALETFSDMKSAPAARRIAVLGDMLELGEVSAAEHAKLAFVVRQKPVDAVFCYGREMSHLAKKAAELGMKNVYYYMDKKDLASDLFAFCRAGDLLLIKGSRGMQMESILSMLEQKEKNSA